MCEWGNTRFPYTHTSVLIKRLKGNGQNAPHPLLVADVASVFLLFFHLPLSLPPFWVEDRIDSKSSSCELPRCSQTIVQNHCQVKLGSTDSMSVKKSILDGRLLPGKSVLIPGLIRDQRLLQNDMPLVRKWTHSTLEIGWKYVRWLTHSFCSLSGQKK